MCCCSEVEDDFTYMVIWGRTSAPRTQGDIDGSVQDCSDSNALAMELKFVEIDLEMYPQSGQSIYGLIRLLFW